MFHKFNSITGRLTGANHAVPNFPLNPVPLNKADPLIVFETPYVKIAQAPPAASRKMSQKQMVPGTSAAFGDVSEALRKKMEMFQRNDGVPIHLKAGAMDRLLFGTTLALCVLGVLSSLSFFYQMSYPKKK